MFIPVWADLRARLWTAASHEQSRRRELSRLIETAQVKRITFHGLRHTCATLLLQAGVPIKVVSERLGHKRIEITLNVYAHALPSMQQDAAVKLGRLIYG